MTTPDPLTELEELSVKRHELDTKWREAIFALAAEPKVSRTEVARRAHISRAHLYKMITKHEGKPTP